MMSILFGINPIDVDGQSFVNRSRGKEPYKDTFWMIEAEQRIVGATAELTILDATTINLKNSASGTNHFFQMYMDVNDSIITSNLDMHLRPTEGAVIRAATIIRFPVEVGRKIDLYQGAYSIDIEPFELVIQSDRNIVLRSDTNDNSVIIYGDNGNMEMQGTLTAQGDIIAGASPNGFFVGSAQGRDSPIMYPLFDMRINGGNIETKNRGVHYTGGILSTLGDESGWTNEGDAWVDESGDTMSGTLNMDSNPITNVPYIQMVANSAVDVTALITTIPENAFAIWTPSGGPISFVTRYNGKINVQYLVTYADRVIGEKYLPVWKKDDVAYLLRRYLIE